jgi:hypothetical protein
MHISQWFWPSLPKGAQGGLGWPPIILSLRKNGILFMLVNILPRLSQLSAAERDYGWRQKFFFQYQYVYRKLHCTVHI